MQKSRSFTSGKGDRAYGGIFGAYLAESRLRPDCLPATAAGMLEAKAGFRRLKAYRQLTALRRALAEQQPRRLETPR